MKIIETGTTYKVYGEDLVVLDNLPVQTYKIGFEQFGGFFLEKQYELEVKEEKIYGVHEQKADKVLDRFNKSRKNLGVILSGDKGIGKSLFARILSNKAIKNGIPVIIVDKYVSGIDDFINEIRSEVLILFDEFDKTFSSKDDNPQEKMLSLFDGTSSGKKLFVITCNRYQSLNEYLINRPGRFHFHFRFDYPTVEEVKEYLKDKLASKYHSEINKVANFSRKVKLNYDCLSAIAFELNEGEIFEEAIKDLNIINESDSQYRYNIKLFTEEGLVFYANNEHLDLFEKNKNTIIWLNDNQDRDDIGISFNVGNLIYNNNENVFVIPKDKFTIEYDTEYGEKENIEMCKKLHYNYVEISLNYNTNIHYNLAY